MTESSPRRGGRRDGALDLSALFLPSEEARRRERRPYQDEAVQTIAAALGDLRFSILALPTGSGKTFVANEVVHDVVASGGTVLWLALNWELLVQAASTYAQRYGVRDLGRVGGLNSPLGQVLREVPESAVRYTTLHTWYRRRETLELTLHQPRLLVIDECHWGINGKMGRTLLKSYHGRLPILGLSATPRNVIVPSGTKPARIIYRKTFSELEGDYLATPQLMTPLTNTRWQPNLLTTGDFSSASLTQLACDDGRNELICRTLLSGLAEKKYSRVMVFACNVDHANRLVEIFSRHGIDARALHYQVTKENPDQRAELIAEFKAGVFNVIVNVAMLTHGVDVPDVDAVFLTRPTASEVLCSQMVGRGARRIEGQKEKFWIVEFTDNFERHGESVFRARDLLPAKVALSLTRGSGARLAVHLPPPEQPTFVRLSEPAEVAGLLFVENQTFGVEIEFTSPLGSPETTGIVYGTTKWEKVSMSIIQTIESVASLPVDRVPRNYHEVNDTQTWRVEFDRSAGWEVVSPILINQEGFSELANVLSALAALQRESNALAMNYRTGLHVTLGSGFTDDLQVQGFARLVQLLEPGLYTLVSPSRLYHYKDGRYSLRGQNKYCRPLRDLEQGVESLGIGNCDSKDHHIRYRTVNLSQLASQDQHIEIRLHQGTTEFSLVISWISLWMTIFNRARFHWPERGSTGRVFPNGNARIDDDQARAEDLFFLLNTVDIHLDPELKEHLLRRRLRLLESWKKVIPRRVHSWRCLWHKNPRQVSPILPPRARRGPRPAWNRHRSSRAHLIKVPRAQRQFGYRHSRKIRRRG